MLICCILVIEVEFTQSMFSGDESSGMVEIRLMASGFSQIPYEVIVVPRQSDPPMALGIHLFVCIYVCGFYILC